MDRRPRRGGGLLLLVGAGLALPAVAATPVLQEQALDLDGSRVQQRTLFPGELPGQAAKLGAAAGPARVVTREVDVRGGDGVLRVSIPYTAGETPYFAGLRLEREGVQLGLTCIEADLPRLRRHPATFHCDAVLPRLMARGRWELTQARLGFSTGLVTATLAERRVLRVLNAGTSDGAAPALGAFRLALPGNTWDLDSDPHFRAEVDVLDRHGVHAVYATMGPVDDPGSGTFASTVADTGAVVAARGTVALRGRVFGEPPLGEWEVRSVTVTDQTGRRSSWTPPTPIRFQVIRSGLVPAPPMEPPFLTGLAIETPAVDTRTGAAFVRIRMGFQSPSGRLESAHLQLRRTGPVAGEPLAGQEVAKRCELQLLQSAGEALCDVPLPRELEPGTWTVFAVTLMADAEHNAAARQTFDTASGDASRFEVQNSGPADAAPPVIDAVRLTSLQTDGRQTTIALIDLHDDLAGVGSGGGLFAHSVLAQSSSTFFTPDGMLLPAAEASAQLRIGQSGYGAAGERLAWGLDEDYVNFTIVRDGVLHHALADRAQVQGGRNVVEYLQVCDRTGRCIAYVDRGAFPDAPAHLRDLESIWPLAQRTVAVQCGRGPGEACP